MKTIEDLMQRVTITAAGCWEWNLGRTGGGYGSAHYRGARLRAHRVSWALHNGPIPEGLWVLHRCDNRPCCNPVHLFLGTPQDNVLDMVQKGRGHGLYKLDAAAVRSLREMDSAGATLTSIAQRLRVRPSTVWQVLKGITWAHVE